MGKIGIERDFQTCIFVLWRDFLRQRTNLSVPAHSPSFAAFRIIAPSARHSCVSSFMRSITSSVVNSGNCSQHSRIARMASRFQISPALSSAAWIALDATAERYAGFPKRLNWLAWSIFITQKGNGMSGWRKERLHSVAEVGEEAPYIRSLSLHCNYLIVQEMQKLACCPKRSSPAQCGSRFRRW